MELDNRTAEYVRHVQLFHGTSSAVVPLHPE